MILGIVDSTLEARVLVTVKSTASAQRSKTVDAVIDTGFNSQLMLPRSAIKQLRLKFHSYIKGLLADGSIAKIATYRGLIFWDGRARQVRVLASDGAALIGMKLLRNYELHVEVVPAGTVTIRRHRS